MTHPDTEWESCLAHAEKLGLGRSYIATQLDHDYQQAYAVNCKLEEQNRKLLKTLIVQESPLPRLNAITNPSIDITQLSQDVNNLAPITVGQIALAEIQSHASMLSWIKEGLTYHSGNSLSTRGLKVISSAPNSFNKSSAS